MDPGGTEWACVRIYFTDAFADNDRARLMSTPDWWEAYMDRQSVCHCTSRCTCKVSYGLVQAFEIHWNARHRLAVGTLFAQAALALRKKVRSLVRILVRICLHAIDVTCPAVLCTCKRSYGQMLLPRRPTGCSEMFKFGFT